MRAQYLKTFSSRLHILRVKQVFLHYYVHQRVQQRNVTAWLMLNHISCVTFQSLSAWIYHDQFRSCLDRIFNKCSRHRMIFGRVRTNNQNYVGIKSLAEGCRYRSRPNRLHQGRDRTRVTKPRAVINIVSTKTSPHHFLYQIGFFIRSFGTTKPT